METIKRVGSVVDRGVSDLSKSVTWLLLFFMASVIFVMRVHTYNEPIERDEGGYAVIAQKILHGGRFFEGTAMDQKPPLVHCTWALAQIIAGYGKDSVFFLNVLAGVVSLIGMYRAGYCAGRSRVIGLWAALFWTVVSGHLLLQANQPNTEVFINACMALGLGFLAGVVGVKKCTGKLLLAGLFFAAASFYKQIVVVIPLFVGFAYVLVPPEGRSRGRALLDMLIVGSGGFLAWGLLILYFTVTGRLQNMVTALVLFNRYYAGSTQSGGGIFSNILRSFFNGRLFPESLYFSIPLILLACFGVGVAIWKRKGFPWLLLPGLVIGTQIAVALPGRFFPHYYQLWFPFLIIGGAWGLGSLLLFKPTSMRAIHITGGGILAILLSIELPNYLFKSPVEWSREKYGEIFIRTDEIANTINSMLSPSETMFQFGEECQLYLATGRQDPSVVCGYYATYGPMADMQMKLMFSDFEKSPPDLFLLEKSAYIKSGYPLIPWLQARYNLIQGNLFHPFYAFVLKGSNLEKRLFQGK